MCLTRVNRVTALVGVLVVLLLCIARGKATSQPAPEGGRRTQLSAGADVESQRQEAYSDYSTMLEFLGDDTLRMPTEEEMEKLGPVWPKIPAEQNAALYFAKAVSLTQSEGIPAGSCADPDQHYEGDVDTFDDWVERNRPALAAMREALHVEDCQYPIFIQKENEQPMLPFALFGGTRHLARTASDAGFLEELKGNASAATEWYLDCIRMGAKTRSSCLNIGSMVGIALAITGHDNLDRLVANADLPQEILERIIAVCAEAQTQPEEVSQIWNDEISYSRALMACGKLSDSERSDLENKLKYSRIVARILAERSRQELLQRKLTKGLLNTELKEYKDQIVFTAFTPPTYWLNWLESLSRLDVRLRSTQVRAAIAIYQKQDGGRLPESLQELCPAILAEVPVDPFAGKPMRYARTDDGWKIWSVGLDNTDNADNADNAGDFYFFGRGQQEGTDHVFRSDVASNLEYRSGLRFGKVNPNVALYTNVDEYYFQKKTFDDVLRYFRSMERLDVRLYPEDADRKLVAVATGRVRDVPLWLILSIVAKSADPRANVYLRDDVIYIGSHPVGGDEPIRMPKGYKEAAKADLDAILNQKAIWTPMRNTDLKTTLHFLSTGPDAYVFSFSYLLMPQVISDKPRPLGFGFENMPKSTVRQILERIAEQAGVTIDYDLFPGIVTFLPEQAQDGPESNIP